MAINGHARAEYALEYTMTWRKERLWNSIDKFQALRHHSGTCNRVEHCKVFNYAAVARLDKGEYVVKRATMAG
jgi:hypothetical protein